MNIMHLPLAALRPNPRQPRTVFPGIEELAASISRDGLLSPLMVREIGEDAYEIVHGERRFRAAQLAGLTEIPAIVRDLTDTEAFTLALVENMQRQSLGPLEEAAAFATLQGQGKSQEEIGALIGKGQSYVAQKLRLLRLPAPLTYYLAIGDLTENHVRQALRLRDLYPPGLRAVEGPDATWHSLLSVLSDEAHDCLAWELLNAARPEQEPISFALSPQAVICEGCNMLAAYVAKHTEGIPQWEMAAFWWLSLAVRHDFSVARLSRHIDRWVERYESALCWWYVVNQAAAPEDAYGWAVYADLKHSASLGLHLDDDRHQSAHIDRLWEKWRRRESLVAPSEIQRRAT